MIGLETVSQDTAFKILSNPRRRAIIYILRTADEPVTVMELAESIAGWEEQRPPETLDRSDRKRVYVSLYQTHIPELEEIGLVERDGDEVRPKKKLYAVDSHLPSETQSFPWYYVTSVASVAALLSLGVISMLPTLGTLSAYVVCTILLGIVMMVATRQLLEKRRRLASLPPEFTPERITRSDVL